jgi:hypothetical protein
MRVASMRVENIDSHTHTERYTGANPVAHPRLRCGDDQ